MKLPYYDGMHIFIDAHGPDHGLFIGFDPTFRTVTIREYSEFPEANPETGRWQGVVSETNVDIDELTNPEAKHQGAYCGSVEDSPYEDFIAMAISYMSYWGCSSDGETIIDLDDDSPCNYFSDYYGPNSKNTFECSLCKSKGE